MNVKDVLKFLKENQDDTDVIKEINITARRILYPPKPKPPPKPRGRPLKYSNEEERREARRGYIEKYFKKRLETRENE